jgi:hypothetical protein
MLVGQFIHCIIRVWMWSEKSEMNEKIKSEKFKVEARKDSCCKPEPKRVEQFESAVRISRPTNTQRENTFLFICCVYTLTAFWECFGQCNTYNTSTYEPHPNAKQHVKYIQMSVNSNQWVCVVVIVVKNIVGWYSIFIDASGEYCACWFCEDKELSFKLCQCRWKLREEESENALNGIEVYREWGSHSRGREEIWRKRQLLWHVHLQISMYGGSPLIENTSKHKF